jgi:hypothetical protein
MKLWLWRWQLSAERRPDVGPLTAQDWGQALVVALLVMMWAFAGLMVVVKLAGARVGW